MNESDGKPSVIELLTLALLGVALGASICQVIFSLKARKLRDAKAAGGE